MRALVLAAVAALILGTAGCTGTSGVVSADGSGGDDVPIMDVGQDTAAPDLSVLDSGFDLRFDGLPEIGLTEVDSGSGPLPGEAGYKCLNGTDCNSGYCVQTADGLQCTTGCVEECPFGWQCLLYSPALPDQVYLCMPTFVDLCRPCEQNDECWTNGVDAGQACVAYGPGGNFCGGACTEDGDCPDGYSCEESQDVTGANVSQCLLDSGECLCTQWDIDASATTICTIENEWGICAGERVCEAAGLTACNAAIPAAEECNGKDDDCDGEADEELSGGECLLINSLGTCPGVAVCDGGLEQCAGDEAEGEQCDGLDNDCDGEVDETFPDTDQDGVADCLENDKDGDGVADGMDNCPADFNPGQLDTDFDSLGDLCDEDDDNDKSKDSLDCAPLDDEVYPEADELCDGKDNNCNFIVDEGNPDSDGDGWKDCVDEDDDGDGVIDVLDCEPLDPASNPEAQEICDGVDNDCDNTIDEGFPDVDEDGIPDCLDDDGDGDGILDVEDNCPLLANPEQDDQDEDGLGDLCDTDLDGDSITNAVDNCPNIANVQQGDVDGDQLGDLCDEDIDGDGLANGDDNCPLVANPGQADSDVDGTGDSCEDDSDGDGFGDGEDCLPLDPNGYPGAEEVCDGLDNDCDLMVDEGFLDSDADSLKDCIDSDDDNDGDLDGTDCAPINKLIHAGALEICDGLDNDCDEMVDGDLGSITCGKGVCLHKVDVCLNGQLQVCDPLEGIAVEVCDGLDNDCDCLEDEDLGSTGCGQGKCQHTVANCQDGEPVVCDPDDGKEQEICDGLDNDCDLIVDEGFADTDADGFKDCIDKDDDGDGELDLFDCAPTDPDVHSQAAELCNGLDDNCNDEVDEELGQLACGKGECFHTVPGCVDGVAQGCDPFLGIAEEVCDGKDNDCNGLMDEALGTTSCGLGVCAHEVPACEDGVPVVCDPLEGMGDEVCDGADNDCNGEVDDGLGVTSCGVGECLHSVGNCADGQPQECDPFEGEIDEICDGLDNNCDGEVDEGFDVDEDGVKSCDGDCDDEDPDNWDSCDSCKDEDEDTYYAGCDAYTVTAGPDCNDDSKAYNPGADPGCDGNDYDCDGKTDNDEDGDGFTDSSCGGTDCADDNADIKPDPAGGCALGKSCKEILDEGYNAGTGTYYVDPDGWDVGNPPVQVHCEMVKDGGGWQRIANNKCFGARNNQYSQWSTDFSGTINQHLVVRLSGCLGNGGGSCYSTGGWGSKDQPGCDGDEQNGFYLTNSGNQEIIGNAQVAKFSNLTSSHVAWYIMSDYCRNSPYLVHTYEDEHQFAAGTYRFWFGEDLHNYTEGDNTGTICVDFFVR